jgi:hypothetical protein
VRKPNLANNPFHHGSGGHVLLIQFLPAESGKRQQIIHQLAHLHGIIPHEL